MDSLKNMFHRLKDLWKSLKKKQQWSIIAAAVFLLAFFFLIVLFSGRVNYLPLFADLEISDQSKIVELLKERNIDYRLDPESSAIFVPEEVVYDLRLSMAAEGLPSNGTVGYEIFDDAKIGMTDFQQQVAYIRALEGELARTIRRFDVVENARVNVVLPRQKLFLREEQPASASVLLKIASGRQPEQNQIKAVIQLVASSVEGLVPEDVSVVDTTGRLLSEMVGDDYFLYQESSKGVSSVQRELERYHEKDLERKVRNMLSAIFGPGNSVTRVRVELDFTKRSSESNQYIPFEKGEGIVRSVQTKEENYSGAAQPEQGVGTASNIPGYAVNTASQSNGDYNKTDEVVNYEISTLHEQEESIPGAIKRITASVVVNAEEDPELREELLASISGALGIDEARGDRMSLSFMKFTSPDVMASMSFEEGKTLGGLFWPALGILGILGGIALLLIYRRRKQAKESKREQPEEKSSSQHPDLWDVPKDEMQVLEEQIRLYAESNPEETASIIKKWLEE